MSAPRAEREKAPRLCDPCNRIYRDTAMIQRPSYGFKPCCLSALNSRTPFDRDKDIKIPLMMPFS